MPVLEAHPGDSFEVADPLRPGNDLFVKNIAALFRRDPRLAQRIDEVPEEACLPLERTRTGLYTAAVPASNGTTKYLHSRYDPQSEAERFLKTFPTDGKYCFVVFGFGLGHHVRLLFEGLKGDASIIIVEPRVEILATAMASADFSDMLRSSRVILLDRVDKPVLHDRLKSYTTLLLLGAQFVVHGPSNQLDPEFHTHAMRLMTDFIAFHRMSMLTLVGNAEATCRNIAYNLPTYLSTPPIDVLKNRFHNKPAIIVSGGPSLRKNIHLLEEAKGCAVIIAVQSMFRPLLERGIEPDFVTTLDFHALSKQFFGDMPETPNVHLIAEPKVSWHVLDQYKGPVSVLHSRFAEELIGPALARRDGLRSGATVSHLAFYLAEYLGCNPIVFTGQDLAFTNHCFYIPGVEAQRTWQSELNRFNTLETKEWERIVRNRSILRRIKDVDGRDIYTDDLLFTYLEQFERDFAETSVRVINATEGGAHIRGTETLTLREVLDTCAREPIDEQAFAYRQEYQWSDTSKWEAARQEIEARVSDIQEVGDVCEEMLEILPRLQKLIDRPDEFNRRLIRVDELRATMHRAQRAYRIVNAAGQLAELQRYSADRKIMAADASGSERATQQLDRDTTYVSQFQAGVQKSLRILRETMGRFDERMRPEI